VVAKGKERPALAMKASPPWIEVVRGPEAEQVVRRVDELQGETIWREAIAPGAVPAFPRSSTGKTAMIKPLHVATVGGHRLRFFRTPPIGALSVSSAVVFLAPCQSGAE
jgi:hypothetical protein